MISPDEAASIAALLLGTVAAAHGLVEQRWRLPGAALGIGGLLVWSGVGEQETPVVLTVGPSTGLHLGDAAVLPLIAVLLLLVRR